MGSLWKGKLLDFRLVKTFFENIKEFRSYDQFNTTTFFGTHLAPVWDLTRSTSLSSFHPTETVQLIPYIYPAFVPFGRYFTSIPLYLWIRQSTLSSTCWPFSSDMLFIVYKQCARSRRVHIEDHMNRFEYCHPGQ